MVVGGGGGIPNFQQYGEAGHMGKGGGGLNSPHKCTMLKFKKQLEAALVVPVSSLMLFFSTAIIKWGSGVCCTFTTSWYHH